MQNHRPHGVKQFYDNVHVFESVNITESVKIGQNASIMKVVDAKGMELTPQKKNPKNKHTLWLNKKNKLHLGSKLIATTTDCYLYPHKIKSNTLSVPYYFGQQVHLSSDVNNLRIILKLQNDTNSVLDFKSVPPSNTFQVWINYYTMFNDGIATLAKHNTSTAYNAELTSTFKSPSGFTVGKGLVFLL